MIRSERIYNFCLLHACFVWLCHVLLELSYTFEPIWTNLLTQCTHLLVSVFCCFCISGFPAIKSASKHQGKIYKKSAQLKLPESPKEGRRATTRQPGGQVARPHPGPRQGPSWLTSGSPRCPLRLYLALGVETPNIDLTFANSPLYRRRGRFKIGAAWRSYSGTLPEGGTPSGRPSIAMDAFRMCRE